MLFRSFGTAETLQNARSARAWFLQNGGQESDLAAHFAALTARPEAARAFGAGQCLTFADGVGGRYSLWSAIGLPVAIALGRSYGVPEPPPQRGPLGCAKSREQRVTAGLRPQLRANRLDAGQVGLAALKKGPIRSIPSQGPSSPLIPETGPRHDFPGAWATGKETYGQAFLHP